MARSSVSTAGISIDTSQLRKLARDLYKLDPKTRTVLRKGLRAGGKIVADAAKANAEYSTRIPGSIKVRTSGVNVSVVAGGKGAGDAAPIENHGKGFVRHPVYGNREVWTAKNSHPAFMAPAFVEHESEVTDQVAQAFDDALREVGFY